MWNFIFLLLLAVSSCRCDDQNDVPALNQAANLTVTSVKPEDNVTMDGVVNITISRKNFPINLPLVAVPVDVASEKKVIETRKENKEEKEGENDLEGVVLALSMKKMKNGIPRWYSQVKNAAKNLFSGLSQRRFKQIRFRGQDPSVTIDLKPEAIVPALKEFLVSKQVQKTLNALASKAAIVYRAFQDDYVKDKKRMGKMASLWLAILLVYVSIARGYVLLELADEIGEKHNLSNVIDDILKKHRNTIETEKQTQPLLVIDDKSKWLMQVARKLNEMSKNPILKARKPQENDTDIFKPHGIKEMPSLIIELNPKTVVSVLSELLKSDKVRSIINTIAHNVAGAMQNKRPSK